MHALWPYLIAVGCLALVLGFLTWAARWIRRRGSGGGGVGAALAAYEEAFRATSHAAYQEIRAEAGRKDPLESPDWLRRLRKRGR
ncbi:hypothetical protein [Streptomyces pseudovenezuelae]|uniref:Uncharacterized protein n=1 Tax=Streptomyces pseudovenezuelae TaxID=67350 RepID=A0ABT6LL70_9ACTN|nr:hypothetical protein [Streptomyces pseudovenezuelae]MDH6217017.1 hypothetical protein [Streptomyces pseudovenezuelae]